MEQEQDVRRDSVMRRSLFEEPRAAALGSVVQHVSRYSELQNEAEAGSWKQSSQGLTNHMD